MHPVMQQSRGVCRGGSSLFVGLPMLLMFLPLSSNQRLAMRLDKAEAGGAQTTESTQNVHINSFIAHQLLQVTCATAGLDTGSTDH